MGLGLLHGDFLFELLHEGPINSLLPPSLKEVAILGAILCLGVLSWPLESVGG